MNHYHVYHELLVPGLARMPVLGCYSVRAATARDALAAFRTKYYLTTDCERLRVVAATGVEQ